MTIPPGDEHDAIDPAFEAAVRGAVTPDSVRAATRARLLARAQTDARERGLPGVRRERRRTEEVLRTGFMRRGVPMPVAGTLMLALAASLVLVVRLNMDRDQLRATYAAADRAATVRLDSLTTLVAARDRFVSALTGPRVQVVGLTSTTAKSPRAMMFWDKATDRWTFVGHNLAQPPAGRTYQLWLVTASRKVSAGTFTVSATGDAMMQATYALDPTALKAVAVTEEPMGGMPQPTGTMVVAGNASAQ